MIVGNDCIDDMDHVTEDSVFKALCGGRTYSAQNYGEFLRKFNDWQIRGMTGALRDFALDLRRRSFPKDRDLILDIDSTSHRQYGKKMEGVEINYQEIPALDSLHVYDQYGFCYYLDVRPGNTFTAKGAAEVIRKMFRGLSKKMHRYLRADSGFCNFGVMHACFESRADFVLAMRANMYEPLLKKVDWWKWKQAKHTKMRDRRLVEIASAPYWPKGLGKGVRVVIIRAKRQQPGLFGELYDYRAFVTNLGQSEMADEEIVDFYRGRGNAENFIKENKNAFDMHHFPCQKLRANKVWGLISVFSYNLMRLMAPVLNPRQLHFAKRIRFRIVYLGAHVVKKSRYTIIRLSNYHYEEVNRFQCRLQNLLAPG